MSDARASWSFILTNAAKLRLEKSDKCGKIVTINTDEWSSSCLNQQRCGEPNMGWSGCPKMVRRGRKISSVMQTYLKPWLNDTKNQTTLIQPPSVQTRQWNPNMGSIRAPAILWGLVWKHFVAGDHMYHKPINIQTEWLDKKEGAGFYKLSSFCDPAFWVRWYPESRHYRPRVT